MNNDDSQNTYSLTNASEIEETAYEIKQISQIQIEKNLTNENISPLKTEKISEPKKDDLNLIESDKKNLILCETFKLVEAEQTKSSFQPEVFERVAALINSKFYKNLEKSLEKIPNQNISKKLKIKLLKIITCFYPANNKIDYLELRKLMSEGLPEELPELRSILWKLFLNYFPNNLNEWHAFSKDKHEDFERIKADLLNGEEQEKYKTIIYEINADVTRTRTDMNFFNININFSSNAGKDKTFNNSSKSSAKSISSDINNDNKSNNNIKDKENDNSNVNKNEKLNDNKFDLNIEKGNNHNDVNFDLSDDKEKSGCNKETGNLGDLLSRILLIFAILHPDLAYIQGMNEILATIYFCFAKSHEEYLESDLFYCFENFMLEVKDIYLKENDNSSRGIHGMVRLIENLLDYLDPELSNHFKEIGIEINFFALRWILIFFSQEFFMPETLRLWDSLLIETDKFKFVVYVSLSVITMKREELLNLGFADAMFSLQNLKNLEFTLDEILINVKHLQHNLDKMYHLLV